MYKGGGVLVVSCNYAAQTYFCKLWESFGIFAEFFRSLVLEITSSLNLVFVAVTSI
jgi:hypothetical protein